VGVTSSARELEGVKDGWNSTGGDTSTAERKNGRSYEKLRSREGSCRYLFWQLELELELAWRAGRKNWKRVGGRQARKSKPRAASDFRVWIDLDARRYVQETAGFFVARVVLARDKARAGIFLPRERAVCG
jgi:hypothetical protein